MRNKEREEKEQEPWWVTGTVRTLELFCTCIILSLVIMLFCSYEVILYIITLCINLYFKIGFNFYFHFYCLFYTLCKSKFDKAYWKGCHESTMQLLATIKAYFKVCGFQIRVSSIESEILHQDKHWLYFDCTPVCFLIVLSTEMSRHLPKGLWSLQIYGM